MHDSISRLLILRRFPGFADADVGELAGIAENVVETEYPIGAVIAPAGRVPALQLVLDGRIESAGASWGPRDVFGALEVLAGRPVGAPAIAAIATRTLQLPAADFAELLEDNFGLLANVRRWLARRLLAAGERPPARLRLPYAIRPDALGLVDRVVLLRHQITLATGRIQALAALAQATRELRFPAGATLARAGDPATGALVIVEGAVRRGRGARGPNDAIGSLEVLAEVPYAESAVALTAVRALECPAGALFDVMEDHTELALAMVSRLAGELLDAPARDDELRAVN